MLLAYSLAARAGHVGAARHDERAVRILARLVLTHYAPRKLPEDAVLIGTYHHGFSSLTFLDDLADVIAALDWAERHQARAQRAQAASA